MQQLINALKIGSDDSSRVANRILLLTLALVLVGLLQAAAAWWPYLRPR